MIQLKIKCSLTNGNKITKRNWHKLVAVSSEPNTSIKGVPEIEQSIAMYGAYFNRWELKYETEGFGGVGYIFREVYSNVGIDGRHKTPKEAVLSALRFNHIKVFLEE